MITANFSHCVIFAVCRLDLTARSLNFEMSQTHKKWTKTCSVLIWCWTVSALSFIIELIRLIDINKCCKLIMWVLLMLLSVAYFKSCQLIVKCYCIKIYEHLIKTSSPKSTAKINENTVERAIYSHSIY